MVTYLKPSDGNFQLTIIFLNQPRGWKWIWKQNSPMYWWQFFMTTVNEAPCFSDVVAQNDDQLMSFVCLNRFSAPALARWITWWKPEWTLCRICCAPRLWMPSRGLWGCEFARSWSASMWSNLSNGTWPILNEGEPIWLWIGDFASGNCRKNKCIWCYASSLRNQSRVGVFSYLFPMINNRIKSLSRVLDVWFISC